MRTVSDIAEEIKADIKGDASLEISSLLPINTAHSSSLCPLFNLTAFQQMKTIPGAVLCSHKLAHTALSRGIKAALIHSSPPIALAKLIDIFFPEIENTGYAVITTQVNLNVQIHPSVELAPGVIIEDNVTINEQTRIGANAVICRGSVIGRNVRIGPGTIIGHEGFGFVPTQTGIVKIRQVGGVLIEDDVEIGANSCIDRGTLGNTYIGQGTKIDNLVQIGHNAQIGSHVIISGQTGIAGSVIIGNRAMLGGQVGIADHIQIGENAKIAAQSGVITDVPSGATFAGYPAVPRFKWLRFFAFAFPRQEKRHDRKV